jgi:hypothetical protein
MTLVARQPRYGRDVRCYATTAALQQARRLGVSGVLETRVEEAIRRGRVNRRAGSPFGEPRLGRDEELVWLGRDLAAVVVGEGVTGSGRVRKRVRRLIATNNRKEHA